MANIKLQNLTSIVGSDLFNDSESFMRDLSEDELVVQGGGITVTSVLTIPLMLIYAYHKYQELKPQPPSEDGYSER
jgi:hypothetical protein